jgi:hypothetical protein
MRTCGRVPSRSPPSGAVLTGPEIPACVLKVKPIWIVFHDELYLVLCAAISPPPEPSHLELTGGGSYPFPPGGGRVGWGDSTPTRTLPHRGGGQLCEGDGQERPPLVSFQWEREKGTRVRVVYEKYLTFLSP